jgi:short-subunit dehydrogenase
MPYLTTFSCALITGASSGLGEEFALQIAPRVEKIVLVARRESLLQNLADRIRARHPKVAVAVFAMDLTHTEERERLAETLTHRGVTPDLLINNAGLGDYGEFATAEWEKIDSMLQVNIAALTHLTYLLLPGMILRGGAIINVSSLASLIPIPDFAVYAATKAYVTSFSEALRIELKEHHIPVLAVCPGPIKTGFSDVSRRDPDSPGLPGNKAFYVLKQQVVSESIAALDRQAARVYPGFKTAVAAVVLTAIPIVILRFALGFRPRKL